MAVQDIGALLARDAELLQRKHLMHLTNALSDQVCLRWACSPRVGWAAGGHDGGLCPQGAAVRAAGAEALAELCSAEDGNAIMLASLAQRHARRLRELMHDVDEGVAVKGVRLLGLLVAKGHLAQDEVSQGEPDAAKGVWDPVRMTWPCRCRTCTSCWWTPARRSAAPRQCWPRGCWRPGERRSGLGR